MRVICPLLITSLFCVTACTTPPDRRSETNQGPPATTPAAPENQEIKGFVEAFVLDRQANEPMWYALTYQSIAAQKKNINPDQVMDDVDKAMHEEEVAKQLQDLFSQHFTPDEIHQIEGVLRISRLSQVSYGDTKHRPGNVGDSPKGN